MPTVLRPNANWDYASSFTINGGSATVHAALSDDSDSTYIKRTSATVPASYYAEFKRNKKRLLDARKEISTCAISGAVGTFAHIDPYVEKSENIPFCNKDSMMCSKVKDAFKTAEEYCNYMGLQVLNNKVNQNHM